MNIFNRVHGTHFGRGNLVYEKTCHKSVYSKKMAEENFSMAQLEALSRTLLMIAMAV
jgi:hypothetical protein